MPYVSNAGTDETRCIFCEPEEENVLARGDEAFVLLNKFPYNTGHLMVAPSRHVGELEELSPTESTEMWSTVSRCVGALKEAMKPHGFNVGINLGKAAGAGVPGHLHVHVVPRWGGDTNFMTTTAETKVLPEMLADTKAKLLPLLSPRG